MTCNGLIALAYCCTFCRHEFGHGLCSELPNFGTSLKLIETLPTLVICPLEIRVENGSAFTAERSADIMNALRSHCSTCHRRKSCDSITALVKGSTALCT